MPAESALVVLIPEAEDLLASFRQAQPSAVPGLAAHVTLLYPFKAPDELTPDLVSALQDLFAGFPGFCVTFAETGRWPGVLYLAPKPAEPFNRLTEAIVRRFPENPPYGGEFAENTPHLTIALAGTPEELEAMAQELHEVGGNRLPIQARVESVTLLLQSDGDWQLGVEFPLGPGDPAGARAASPQPAGSG